MRVAKRIPVLSTKKGPGLIGAIGPRKSWVILRRTIPAKSPPWLRCSAGHTRQLRRDHEPIPMVGVRELAGRSREGTDHAGRTRSGS